MNHSRWRSSLILALLLATGTIYIIRGPLRELRDSGDFAAPYASARCWLAGLNPYLQTNIDREYRLADGDPAFAPSMGQTPSLYPASAFVLISPLAAADWKTATVTWMIISNVAFLTSILLILRFTYTRSPGIVPCVLAFFLFFSAPHAGFAKGQPSILTISLIVVAIYLPPFAKRDLVAGLLVGLSCCFKPQIALPFLFLFGWQRRWRVIGTGIGVVILVWVAALPNLIHASPNWAADWVNTIQSSTNPGGANDPSFRSGSSFQLVNFQSVVGFFTDQPVIYNLFTFAMIVGVAAVVFALKRPQPQQYWLVVSWLTVLELLGSYHRYYDLQLLLLCTGGLVTLDWTGRRGTLLWILGLVACLSVPLQVIAAQAYSAPALASKLAMGGRPLAFVALHHQPLCLLAIALVFGWLIVASPQERYFEPRQLRSATTC